MKTRVQEEREKQGYKPGKFAEAIGISRQSLYNIEQGSSAPSLLTALRISRLLQIDVNDLWDLETLEENQNRKKRN